MYSMSCNFARNLEDEVLYTHTIKENFKIEVPRAWAPVERYSTQLLTETCKVSRLVKSLPQNNIQTTIAYIFIARKVFLESIDASISKFNSTACDTTTTTTTITEINLKRDQQLVERVCNFWLAPTQQQGHLNLLQDLTIAIYGLHQHNSEAT